MPELPEVTVIVNSLNKKIKGLILESIEYDWPKGFHWGRISAIERHLGEPKEIGDIWKKLTCTKSVGIPYGHSIEDDLQLIVRLLNF